VQVTIETVIEHYVHYSSHAECTAYNVQDTPFHIRRWMLIACIFLGPLRKVSKRTTLTACCCAGGQTTALMIVVNMTCITKPVHIIIGCMRMFRWYILCHYILCRANLFVYIVEQAKIYGLNVGNSSVDIFYTDHIVLDMDKEFFRQILEPQAQSFRVHWRFRVELSVFFFGRNNTMRFQEVSPMQGQQQSVE